MKMNTTVSVARALSNRYGVNVRMQGVQAYTDGKAITIPDLGSELDDRKMTLLRGYIDHEAGGHGRHTDFSALRDAGMVPEQVVHLCNAIEDIRVEALLGREFEGCRQNLTALNQLLLEERIKKGDITSPDIVLLANGFKQVAGQPLENVPDIGIAQQWFGNDILERVAACKSTRDGLELARELVGRLEHEVEKLNAESPESAKDEEGEEQGNNESAGGEQEQAQEDSQEQPSEGQSEAGESGGGEEGKGKEDGMNPGNGSAKLENVGDSKGEDVGVEFVSGTDGDGGSGIKGAVGAGIKEGDEKMTAAQVLESLRETPDKGEMLAGMLNEAAKENLTTGGYSVFSKEDDEVIVSQEASSESTYSNLRAALGSLNTVRAKVTRAFQSEKAIRWIGDRDQGKINNRALFRAAVGSNRVFKQRVESRHVDTAATFLVDFSGSMQERSAGIERICYAMRAVVLFLESLEQAGVASEVLGYTTGSICNGFYEYVYRDGGSYGYSFGRIDSLLTIVFKAFSERMSARIRRRISNYRNYETNQNCDADSLRVAYERIMRRKERRKIIFVLTDGAVCSNGNDYAGRDELKRLVASIEREGQVELVAVDLMSGQAEEYYKKTIMVDDGRELAAKLLEGLKRFLF